MPAWGDNVFSRRVDLPALLVFYIYLFPVGEGAGKHPDDLHLILPPLSYFVFLGRGKTTTSNILNFSRANTEWGLPAGIRTLSPLCSIKGFPSIVTLPSPSRTVIIASPWDE